jgi:hypothetical protein
MVKSLLLDDLKRELVIVVLLDQIEKIGRGLEIKVS